MSALGNQSPYCATRNVEISAHAAPGTVIVSEVTGQIIISLKY